MVNCRQAILSIVLSYTLGFILVGQSSDDRTSREQSLFSAEDDTVERPVKIPSSVLELLARDELIVRYLRSQGKSPDELTGEPFLASAIHLDGPAEIDLIATGTGRLRGNVATFWVFQPTHEGYRLVLHAVGHDLKVLRSRWKGYREIETASPIAGSASLALYRFDGQNYRLAVARSESIR